MSAIVLKPSFCKLTTNTYSLMIPLPGEGLLDPAVQSLSFSKEVKKKKKKKPAKQKGSKSNTHTLGAGCAYYMNVQQKDLALLPAFLSFVRRYDAFFGPFCPLSVI